MYYDAQRGGLSNKEKVFLNRAKKLAATSECRIKHGCIIVKGGSVVAVSTNKYRNNPDSMSDPNADSSYHAEIAALKKVKGGLTGAVAYIARVNNFGAPRMSRPCQRCMVALKEAGVKRVIFTIEHSLNFETKEEI